jgi:hypothetical protein
MKITPELKREWWGEGEWVNEPDEEHFDHLGVKCRIVRVMKQEMNGSMFGGHFCGYIMVPEGHPWIKKDSPFSIDADVHWGITYGEYDEHGKYWIGFDCAHLDDYIPSMEAMKKPGGFLDKHTVEMEELRKKLVPDSPLAYMFNPIYRNIEFVREQCRDLVQQMIDWKEIVEVIEGLPK